MSDELFAAIVGGGGTLFGFLLSEVSTNIKRKKDEKERFLMANYNQRQQAYASVYSGLIEYQNYFYKFVDYGNEFAEHFESNQFGPLSEMSELTETFEMNRIWVHEKTITKIENLLANSSSSNNIALYVAMGDEEIGIEQVEPISRSMIEEIEDCKVHIREMTGMLLLDEYQVKFIKSKK